MFNKLPFRVRRRSARGCRRQAGDPVGPEIGARIDVLTPRYKIPQWRNS